MIPAFDAAAVRAHLEMLHGLAAAAGADGHLALSGYGENPDTGKRLRERNEHFRIGDVDGMLSAVMAYEHLPHLNAYAPWSIVRKGLDRGKRGGEADVVAVLALVPDLDGDTGKAGELPLLAPYAVETSPGNLQPVYPFARALAPREAKPIAEALADAIGCDARTKDLSGVWRIPGTLNWPSKRKLGRGRAAAPFPVRVATAWAGELVDAEHLTAAVSGHAKPRADERSHDTSGPAGSVEALLRRCGARLRRDLRDPPVESNGDRSPGAFAIICALVARGLSDADIEALVEAHPDGVGRRYAEGKDLGSEIDRARRKTGRPIVAEATVIRVVPGELPRVVSESESALIASGLPVFSRAGALVRPIVDTIPAAHGRTTTVAKFKELCPDTTVDLLSRVATFLRFDKRSDDWVSIDPPQKAATVLLAREGEWQVNRAVGIITTPTLRPDGSILSEAGYDPATRLYLAPDALPLPAIPDQPTREDAAEALSRLAGLLVGFPFVGAVDRAVALAGIITAVTRGAMAVSPLFAIRAHSAGTGKSFLVDVVSAIATGRLCPVIAAGKTEEETEKRLGSLLRDAVPIVSIDNVNGELGGDALCQMTERPLVRIRILGKTETPEFECKATIFATGNNLTLVGDMTRRTVLCSLDAGVERPELRQFGFDPVAAVLADRASYVAAALTIAKAYRAAGTPRVCDPIGSYGEWSATVRAPLVWLGEVDPVASMETARDEDPELAAIRELHGHWTRHLSEVSPYTTSAVIQAACEREPPDGYGGGASGFRDPEFRDLLLRVAGDGGAVSSRRLGKWLARISGKIVDRRRLEMRVDGSHGNKFFLSRQNVAA